ncbi:acetamidase/formamidase family protein [Corallococcus sp. bb12-1]|uniref:acetamidase/formamidase family protein n=1 Tax=Corallococcus sp. bb12-1 TaxID=2996784 RepID=UPI00226E4247|nr:acetamidase/formamidase family protein [Corallococcus sp. bb12-1]MCY1044879.1 acetamidase/formamidase family protein [Corallococcus sp. bb12-1]
MPRLLVLLLCCLPTAVLAASESWLVTTDLWGNPAYQTLTLERAGKRLTGELDGDSLEGERVGNDVRFVVTDARKQTYVFSGKVGGEVLRGAADYPDSNNPKTRVTHSFTARLLPVRPAGPPRVHEFKPTSWSNEFSAHREPVLTVWPGDTVRTTTLDSGGMDEHGVTRALFGNPQTGPFFIATAEPGDTLVVRLKRLRLNRTFADSLDSIVGRALTTGLAAKATELGKPVRWKLDLERGVASPETPTERMKHFTVPLRPMLGGLAVAPGFGSASPSTGDTGRSGGNMDFNEVVEGNTVFLPVSQPGALLYLGDAHAAQGDGETSQYALETSMEVEFTVDVVHGKAPPSTPRVESPTHLMALGQGGSLDDALRSATQGLTQWLEQEYGLTLSESAQVLGSSVQYVVANLAGRSVGVVAKLEKARLAKLLPVGR